MDKMLWDNGLAEIEENLGTATHKTFSEGERDHLKRRIYDREGIVSGDWKLLIDWLIDNKTYLPKVKDFRDGLQAIRTSTNREKKGRFYIQCARCNPDGVQDSKCGYLYTRAERWAEIDRQIIPCGCGNTLAHLAEIPTFNDLSSAGKIKIEDVERFDGSMLTETQEQARARKWEAIKKIHEKGGWIPEWMIRRLEGDESAGPPGYSGTMREIKKATDVPF